MLSEQKRQNDANDGITRDSLPCSVPLLGVAGPRKQACHDPPSAIGVCFALSFLREMNKRRPDPPDTNFQANTAPKCESSQAREAHDVSDPPPDSISSLSIPRSPLSSHPVSPLLIPIIGEELPRGRLGL